jgi:hypothetical protein
LADLFVSAVVTVGLTDVWGTGTGAFVAVIVWINPSLTVPDLVIHTKTSVSTTEARLRRIHWISATFLIVRSDTLMCPDPKEWFHLCSFFKSQITNIIVWVAVTDTAKTSGTLAKSRRHRKAPIVFFGRPSEMKVKVLNEYMNASS